MQPSLRHTHHPFSVRLGRYATALLALLLGVGFVASSASPALGFPVGDPGFSDGYVMAGSGPVEEAEIVSATNRYFVVLDDPPLAQYRGGIPGLAPTAVDAVVDNDDVESRDRSVHLDTQSDAARAYVDYLEVVQESYIQRVQRLAPEFQGHDWQYQVVLNGFVAELTPQHAIDLMRLPGVRLVYPEEELVPEMDSTAVLLNTVKAWEAAGGTEEAGLGARVAILEGGNAKDHPFFRDEGMPEPPEGYPSAKVYGADGTAMDLLEPERLLNNKIIGARVFVQQVVTTSLGTYTTSASNHGRHVSGTVAGRYGTYDLGDLGAPGVEVSMGGVAPMAWVFHYYNMDGTPGMVKAYEVMIEDEIDAVNLSLGHVGWLIDRPETHPIALAQAAAAEAGVLSVGSAGNAGANGRTSLSGAWKYSEDIMTVGNTTTTGSLTSDVLLEGEAVPAEIERLTAGPPRGNIAITETITAEIILADDGGCIPDPKYADKIAVVERFNVEGSSNPIGSCGYQARAQNMADSGAVATIYIYYNLYLGTASRTVLALPTVAMGARDGTPLVEWLRGGGTGTASIIGVVSRTYENVPDILSGSSSRGPGLDWTIKPDITAPGTGILSSVMIDDDGSSGPLPPRGGFASYSGTSMSAPHVTGAAGLLRSFHPDWTVPQLRSALINTSKRVVQVGSVLLGDLRPANPTEAGPGRLDLEYAYDPRALLYPPKASFGNLPPDVTEELQVRVESVSHETMGWELSVEQLAGDAQVTIEPESFIIQPSGAVTLTVTIDTAGVAETEHWGDILLRGRPMHQVFLPALLSGAGFDDDEVVLAVADGTVAAVDDEHQDDDDADDKMRELRLVYYAYVDIPENREDVLIVNWTYGPTEDFTSYYTDALDELGLTYSVWSMGDEADGHEDRKTTHPTFEEMYRHDLVILNANMSPVSLQEALRGQYQYQNYMLSGGSFLIAGQGTQDWWRYLGGSRLADNPTNRARYSHTWPYRWYGASQNVGCEMCLARYFAGFTPELTATLSARLMIPYPMRPDEPEMEVVLQPHPDADESVFDYPLDISTGAMAKDGAAGNQYYFASGDVMKNFVPSTSSTDTTKLGDISYGEVVLDRIAPHARPLWSYPVSDTVKVVGTYVAGKHDPDAEIAWNAMFWGFGLEGVGEGAEATVSRSRLLGDTFNFMARNMTAEAVVLSRGSDGVEVGVRFSEASEVPVIARTEIDWGDGFVEQLPAGAGVTADGMTFRHQYDGAGTFPVSIKLVPAEREHAAPIYVETELEHLGCPAEAENAGACRLQRLEGHDQGDPAGGVGRPGLGDRLADPVAEHARQ